MNKSHFIVAKATDGQVEFHPMKQWLRENPQHLPAGFSPDGKTSHQVRAAMRKEGWLLQQNGDRVLLIRPDATEDITNAVSMLANSDDDDEVLEAEEITFGLERDLQAALRTHIDQLEPGLRITDGGKERSTEAGRIDITATDPSGAVVVIELKAGTATPEVVAQILAYMGSVADEDNKPVRGILVAGDFHKRVILASRAISNLELRKYSFQFKFDAVS